MIKLKKLITIVLLSFFLLGTVVRTTYAQEQQPLDSDAHWSDLVRKVAIFTGVEGEHVPQFVNKQGEAALESMFMNACLGCTTGGMRVINDPSLSASAKTGLLETSEKAVYAMFNSMPTVDVPSHLAQQWVPGYADSSSTYAAGYEDLQTSKVDVLWTTTRDIAYIGFVVIMIAIGFMIMFRHKIGGQVMVTVGNAIPKVVVALVLVTFSFAIIGLIVDVGAFIMRLIQILLYGTTNMDKGVQIANPVSMFTGFFGKNITNDFFGPDRKLSSIVLAILAFIVPGLNWVSMLFGLIIVGILFWGMVKLWFTLVKAYLGIIINVIAAPLAIFAGAIPGNEASTINIFKSALRNVLVFPIAYAIVNLPYYAELKGIQLTFPETLVGEGAWDLKIGGFMLNTVKIIAIYAAASAPSIAAVIVPPTASKQAGDAAAAFKASLSGVPFIGGFFK